MTGSPLAAPKLGSRELFPHLLPLAYLNHAAISPPSIPVEQAVEAVLTDYRQRGVGAVGDWFTQRDRLREKIAQLLSGEAKSVALTPNTTRGVTDVALCFPWEKGDRIVLIRGEFPSNVTPWQRAAEHFGLEIDWLDSEDFRLRPDAALRKMDQALLGRPKLLAVSLVQFQTGFRMPIEEITRRCHHRGAQVFVDGIQGLGVVPFEVGAVDYVACGSHKWLMGLEGAGFLYVRQDRAKQLVPRVAGWLSHEEPLKFLFEGEGHLRYDRPIIPEAKLVEGGAMNAMGFAALEASIDLILQLSVRAIHEHVTAYLDELQAGLASRGFHSLRSTQAEGRSGTLSVIPPSGTDPIALHPQLEERDISCSTPDGKLRFSPHFPNSQEAEVPLVLEAIDIALG